MKNKKGFTLVELVVVVAILGILAGLAIPRFMEASAEARTNRAAADMQTLQRAVDIYVATGREMPKMSSGSSDSACRANGKIMFQKLLDAGLIAAIPEPPIGNYYMKAYNTSHNPGNDLYYGFIASATSHSNVVAFTYMPLDTFLNY